MTDITLALLPGVDTIPHFVLRLAFGVTLAWGAAWVASCVLRRASAALRHRVWAMGTVAALTMPTAVLLLPEWRVGAIRLIATPEPAVIWNEPVKPSTLPDSAAETFVPRDVTPRMAHESAVVSPTTVRVSDVAVVPRPFPRMAAAMRPAQQPRPWARWLALGWLIPALWLLVRQLLAHRMARRLVRESLPVRGGPAADCLARLSARHRVGRTPGLLMNPAIRSPLCMGWARPAILLPGGWRSWTSEQLQAVLTHELAHVARRDVWWQVLARLACALYWPHPLAWVAAWRWPAGPGSNRAWPPCST